MKEVAIIGAGPIGLELAVNLKLLGVDYVHLEKGQIGQTISWYPLHTTFFSSPERIAIAGVPLQTPDQAKASREQYLAYLRGVVEEFDLAINTFEKVTRIDKIDGGFRLTTEKLGGTGVYEAKNVVIAIGDMHRPRMLNVPGEDLPHVSHYFHDPHQYFRKRLLIVGGRNSAVEAALRCHRAGARVSISYRRGEFDQQSIKYWLLPEIQSLTKKGLIAFYPNTLVQRITPTHVTLGATDGSGATREVEADFVLLLVGYVMDPTLFEIAGVQLEGDQKAPVFDPHTMQTNVPGIYVAGTAAAGTQVRFRLFIENCHPHVTRIVRSITGRDPVPGRINPVADKLALPES